MAEANGYSVVAQAWYFPVAQEESADTLRSLLSRWSKKKLPVAGICQIEGILARDAYAWLAEHGLPRLPENTLYCIACLKEKESPFAAPTDIYV